MDNEIIKLKGTGDGVKIQLSSDAAVSDILRALQDKLRSWRKFFGTGHCNMYFTGRKLTKSDELRLEAVVSALLPEAAVFYGERKGFSDTVQLPKEFVDELKRNEKNNDKHEPDIKISTDMVNADKTEDLGNSQNLDNTDYTDVASDISDTDVRDETRQFEAIRDVITTNFKSNRARLFEGTVRAGRVVESDGHLVLVGDVMEGGTLVANGNVIVLGHLFGSVQAGCMGNTKAYIIAADMKPTDIRIAHSWRKYDDIDTMGGFKKAKLTDNEVFMEDFLANI